MRFCQAGAAPTNPPAGSSGQRRNHHLFAGAASTIYLFMHANAVSASSKTMNFPDQARHVLRGIGPLGLVILLHIGFFYALYSGLLQAPAPVPTKEIVATLITPAIPQPARPVLPPTPVPVQPAPKPVKPAPPPKPKPSPKAISSPKAPPEMAPAPIEPAIVAAPSAPASPAAPALPAEPVPPATPTAPAQPKSVSSGVEYLQAPAPEYPPLSRRMGEEGTVMLRVLVNERGRPDRVEIHKSSGTLRLDEAARRVVASRYVFKPYMENGKPIPVFVTVPIIFNLNS